MQEKVFLGWWQVAACVLLQAVSTATVSGAFSVVAVPIGEAFDTSRMLLMLPMTVCAAAVGLLSPVLGAAMDRTSMRNLMLLGALGLVAGYVALSFSTSMTQVLLIYGVLMSPANVLLGPTAAAALLSRWFSKRRGAALGIAAAGISAGGIVFPPIIQLLIDSFEWRAAFLVLSGIIFVLTVPAIFLIVVDRPSDRNLHPDGAEVAEVPAGGGSRAVEQVDTGRVLRDANFWLIAVVMAVLLCGNKGLLTNVVPLAIELGTRPDLAAMLISLFSAGSFTGKMLFAGLADRFDPRIVLATAVAGFAFGMSCFWQAEAGYAVMAAGGALMGLAAGGVLPLKGLLLAQSFGAQNVGRVMGLMTLAIMPLNLVAPPLFGWIYDRTGSYDAALLLFVGMAGLAALTLPRIRTGSGALSGAQPAPVPVGRVPAGRS